MSEGDTPRAETEFSAAQREWIDRLIADKIAEASGSSKESTPAITASPGVATTSTAPPPTTTGNISKFSVTGLAKEGSRLRSNGKGQQERSISKVQLAIRWVK